MTASFNQHEPIYIQLLERFRARIVNGSWEPGARIDSVRALALEYGVNPNTIQRALSELEREGLAYSERTAGRFITEDQAQIDALRGRLADDETTAYIARMQALHLSYEETAALLSRHWNENKRGQNHGNH